MYVMNVSTLTSYKTVKIVNFTFVHFSTIFKLEEKTLENCINIR